MPVHFHLYIPQSSMPRIKSFFFFLVVGSLAPWSTVFTLDAEVGASIKKNLQSYNSKPFILMSLSQITLSILQGEKRP